MAAKKKAKPEPIEETPVESGEEIPTPECVRASSKVTHLAKSLSNLLDSIDIYWDVASDEARVEAAPYLSDVYQRLDQYFEE